MAGESEGQPVAGGRRQRGAIIPDTPEQQMYSEPGARWHFFQLKENSFLNSPWIHTFQSCYFPTVNRTFSTWEVLDPQVELSVMLTNLAGACA